MEHTIPAGNFIMGTRLYGEPEVGDVIIFEHEGQYLVKRIVGCPGEAIYLNEITFMDSKVPPDRGTNRLIVPQECYYVLGNTCRTRLIPDTGISHTYPLNL